MKEDSPTFVEDAEYVHVVNPLEVESTLCGIWHCNPDNGCEDTRKRTVNCPVCIRHLKTLRQVKFREKK